MAKRTFTPRSTVTGKIPAGKSIVGNPTTKAGVALRNATGKPAKYVTIEIAHRAGAVAAALGSEGPVRTWISAA